MPPQALTSDQQMSLIRARFGRTWAPNHSMPLGTPARSKATSQAAYASMPPIARWSCPVVQPRKRPFFRPPFQSGAGSGSKRAACFARSGFFSGTRANLASLGSSPAYRRTLTPSSGHTRTTPGRVSQAHIWRPSKDPSRSPLPSRATSPARRASYECPRAPGRALPSGRFG